MSVILVVEQDASTAERIRDVLRSSDRSVTVVETRSQALSQAEREVPDLLLAGSGVPEAAELLAGFSRRQGGPGAVVVVPAAEVTETTADDYRADEILAQPFSDTGLVQLIDRCLEQAPVRPTNSPAAAGEGEQLTSADIFGDVLAEVEAEAKGSEATPRPARSKGPLEDIERKLEETLSGVIPSAGKTRRSRTRKRIPDPPSDAEIDDLLDQTLSSLDLPTRGKRPSAAVKQTPTEEPAAEPAPAEPQPAAEAPMEEPTFPAEEPAQAKPATPASDDPEPTTSFALEPPPELPSLPDFEPLSEPPVELEPAASRGRETDETLQPTAAAETDPTFTTAFETPIEAEAPAASESLSGLEVSAEAPPSGESDASLETGSWSPEDEQISPPASFADPASTLGSPDDGALSKPLSDLRDAGDQFATQALPVHDLLQEATGESFGDYTLLERIAVGGMAEVWRARRRGVEGFQKTVAIKKILSHLTGSADFVTMFIDEAKLAAQLTHNNIIQIYDLGKVGEDFFIAMEFVEGKDLRSILSGAQERSRPVPPGLGLYIVGAVARALDYAHRKRDFEHRALGLVHRDVSPQNVMISHEGEIKLCDFGIVKAVAKASTTQMGALKGKLQYMSPEQAWGKSVDARSDIFSLGSVLYEVLTGQKLFSGESEIGVLDAVRACEVTSPREIVPELPETIARIVLKALAKAPEDRFQTAGDMAQELQAALDELKPTPSQTDLAGYLRELFADPQPEVGTAATEPDAPAEAEAAAVVAATATDSPPETAVKPRSGALKWLVAALVAIAVLVGVIVATRPKAPEAPAAAGAGTGPSQATEVPGEDAAMAGGEDAATAGGEDAATAGGEAPAGTSAPAPDSEDGSDAPPAAATDGDATDGPTESGSGEGVVPTGAAGIDIEQMVNEELSSRAERLRRDFEAEKRRIEEELAKTQPTEPEGGDDSAPEQEPEPDGGGGGESEDPAGP